MKVNRYDDFINESKLVELLLESILVASGEFMDRLDSISKESMVAKKLLKGFKKRFYIYSELPQNFIDVAPEEDLISFISDKKASDVDDPYTAKGRGTIKVGRFVNALVNNRDVKGYFFDDYTPTPKDIEEFVNLYKSKKVETSNQFKLVDGKEIAWWYDEKRYYSEQGQLGNSCMKDVDKSFFDIYTDNPRVCKLLIYVNEKGELLGRALVWKMHKSPVKGVEWFMDRVYTNRDSDINKFKDYARKEGWLYKFKNSYDRDESVLFYHGSTPIIGRVVVKLRNSEFDEYPFIDTLSFFDKKEGTLSNVGSKKAILLTDTGGEDSGSCSYCDGSGKQKEWDHKKDKEVKIPCEECVGIVDKIKLNIEDYPEFANSPSLKEKE